MNANDEQEFYNIVTDGDGHVFVIPSAYNDAWQEFLRALEEMPGEITGFPMWAEQVDSVSSVQFTSYSER